MNPFINQHHFNLGEYFYKLAECSQDVFWIRSPDFKTQLYISPAYEKIWGYSCSRLYQDPQSWFETIHIEDREWVLQDINRIRNQPTQGDSYSREYRIINSFGEIRWIQESGFPLFNADNQVISYAGVAKDITHNKQRIMELLQATYFFRFFVEKMQQAVFWVRDPICEKQIYVSPSYEKIWGKTCESLYENPASWIDTLFPEDRDPHSAERRLQLLKEKGANVTYEDRYRIYDKDGNIIWIKDTSFPIYDDHNNFIGFAGIAENITKDVLQQKELHTAKQRAEVASQAKTDFLGMVSHELRTPLNAILGVVQILQIREFPAENKQYFDIIYQAGNNLLSLVNDILDFVQVEAGKLSFNYHPFNLSDLISQVLQSLQHQANEKKLDFVFECADAVPNAVIGDANRIRQVLVNLLTNAIKFTDKGRIRVLINCIKKTTRQGLIEIKVEDTGIGIHPDRLEYVFEKFSQIDSVYYRKQQGFGLGLAIAKELVEKMKGEISVESKIGEGSTFCFTLPLALQKEVETESVNEGKPDRKRNYKLNICLVEDNIINQKIAYALLKELGCTVDILNDGHEILEKISFLEKYDLILMDIGLPDISGFDIVSRLRKEITLANIPIVAVTAHILERDRQQALEAGIDMIIPKPINYAELAAVLDKFTFNKRS